MFVGDVGARRSGAPRFQPASPPRGNAATLQNVRLRLHPRRRLEGRRSTPSDNPDQPPSDALGHRNSCLPVHALTHQPQALQREIRIHADILRLRHPAHDPRRITTGGHDVR